MIKSIFRLTSASQVLFHARRNLYAAPTLGIDGYISTREKIHNQYANNIEVFKEKMKEFVSDKPGNIVFTEDLKNMVHLAESKEDVELVVKMMKKFNNQNKELRFGNFVFGPVVLRMFYHLNQPDIALECLKDPELNGFFDQIMSFQILMDMLYKKQRYSDVLDVFELVKSRQLQGGKYPKHIVVLAMAACYKMNTKESFDYCIKLWQDLKEVGHDPMRKAATFAAALALSQNSPHITLEILSTLKQQNYLTVRNLKVIAYAEIDRPEEALPILRSVLEIDSPINTKFTFIKYALQKVQESIERNGKKEIETDFKRIEKFLTERRHLTDETLDQIISSEITVTSFNGPRKEGFAASFRKTTFNQNAPNVRNRRAREGLRELY